MKKIIFGLLSLTSISAFADSYTYNCDSKEIFSGQRFLGVSQQVIINESTSIASFIQKNYSPQASWRKIADLNADNSSSLSDRFTTKNSDIIFYRTVTTFIENELPIDKTTSDGVLVIKMQNAETRSFLCKLEKNY